MNSITITGALKLPKTEAIRKALTFPNPFDDEKSFKAFFETKTHLIIPRAYPTDLTGSTLSVIDVPCEYILGSNYTLRDYQSTAKEEIIEYFKDKPYGELLLTAQCGAGKSYVLSSIIAGLGQRVLILSHLSMLSTQLSQELKNGLPTAHIEILSSKSDTNNLPDIGIATFQLLQNAVLLDVIKNHYGIVIVDEAENSFSTSRLRVLFSLRPKYQLFLTATPSKTLLNQTHGLQYLIGNKVVNMTAGDEHSIHTKHLMVDMAPLQWYSPSDPNKYKVSLGKFMLTSGVIHNVCSWVSQLHKGGVQGTIWIIADLAKVQDAMAQELETLGLSVRIIRGTTSNKKRVEILKEISEGKVSTLIGSAPLAAGISIKELSIGIRLMPNSSSEELLQQQSGRLKRFIEFKTVQNPLWLDFNIPGSLSYGANKRYGIYKGTTHGVAKCKPEDVVDTIIAMISIKEPQ